MTERLASEKFSFLSIQLFNMLTITPPTMNWLCLIAGALIVLIYEIRVRYLSISHPMNFARTAHAHIRAEWVRSIMRSPGEEILAIQTLRNSVMSSTVIGSTAVLALMGTLTVTSTYFNTHIDPTVWSLMKITPRFIVWIGVVSVLFATVVLSIMAVRFYNHGGYMITLPAASEKKMQLVHTTETYIVRAGIYYSMSLRTFLWMVPMAIGLIAPFMVPLAALVLVGTLNKFDRVPALLERYTS